MTVLRSREIVPQSPPKTLRRGVIEPVTPAKALEDSNHPPSYSTTPSSSPFAQSPDLLGLGSNSVLVVETIRRRSLRLASKPSSDAVLGNAIISSRKRKNVAAEIELKHGTESFVDNIGREDVGNIENGILDLEVKRVRVSDRIRRKTSVSGELGVGVRSEEKDWVEGTEMGSNQLVSVMDEVDMVRSTSYLGSARQCRKRPVSAKTAEGKKKLGTDVDLLGLELLREDEGDKRSLSLRSGKKIAKKGAEGNSVGCGGFVGAERDDGDKSTHGNGRRGKDRESERVLNGGTRGSEEGVLISESERDPRGDESGSLKGLRRFNREEKRKGKLVDKGSTMNSVDPVILELGTNVEISNGNLVSDASPLLETADSKESEKGPRADIDGFGVRAGRGFSREEKGKDKVVEHDLLSNIDVVKLDLKTKLEKPVDDAVSGSVYLADNVTVQDGGKVMETKTKVNATAKDYKERFREIARKNASRFAHFSSQQEENYVIDDAERETPQGVADREIEDWPGPFSTAMKIIKDREMNVNVNVNVQQQNSLDKRKLASVIWIPKKDQQHGHSKQLAPSLQELCAEILCKNADAITSLDNVPDVLRHKLSQLLCDSRRMKSHFLDLLVRGSPTEIRIRDCSWLSEEQFMSIFAGCDTNNLMVLQLDQCGRCLPDYILFSTIARISNSLPVLSTISLKGACRFSDAGLSALVSAAPALRSVNLSQCSLLTSEGINMLADSLGSVLRELYIDDCQCIDVMGILPALSRIEHLEVLSLAGIQTVCDDFIGEFVAVCGCSIKELVLTDCVELTDYSLKAIAETCSGLCAIDLVNLQKLTDSAIGYLANGCRAIQKLKLCRNAFSDEAVAAYVEACGETLKELSLNNVNKVAHNTAISLARRSRNLLSLDLSWCRNLTNEALGLIVDSCLSLKVLKLFGCTQIANVFLDGHSNPHVKIIGLKMTPILKHLMLPDPLEGPLHYSSVCSAM